MSGPEATPTPTEVSRPRERALELVAMALALGASRLAWSRAGLPFRSDALFDFAQLLDPPLLETRLLESLLHLHAQPPLLNLLAGLALKLAPTDPAGPLQAIMVLAGFATGLALFDLLRTLGLGRWLAGALALGFCSTPAFVLFEHWFFYPHLSAALLTIAAACLLRSRGGANAWVALGLVALAALVWLRSLFHPLYFFAAAAGTIALARPGERARMAGLVAPATGLVLALALKNLILFGFFGTSSWGGNSLHKIVTRHLPEEVIARAVERGALTRLSLEWEFSKPEIYLEILAPDPPPDPVPALAQTAKTRATWNPVNYNHWVYPIASRVYGRSALWLLHAHPDAYLRSIAITSRYFLEPVSLDPFVRPIRAPVARLARPFEAAARSPWVRVAIAGAVVGLGLGLVAGRMRQDERLGAAFLVGTIAWVAAAGILLEYGENNRFRHQLGPLLLAAVVLSSRLGLRVWRRWRSGHGGAPAGPVGAGSSTFRDGGPAA